MQKHFSEEFKRAAIARVQNGETQVEVAQSLHISPKTLNRWCVKAKGVLPPEGVSLIEENARLRKALKQREAEVEFLKKSLEPDSLSRGKRQNFPLTTFVIEQRKQTFIENNFY